jgi:hypothetical protein
MLDLTGKSLLGHHTLSTQDRADSIRSCLQADGRVRRARRARIGDRPDFASALDVSVSASSEHRGRSPVYFGLRYPGRAWIWSAHLHHRLDELICHSWDVFQTGPALMSASLRDLIEHGRCRHGDMLNSVAEKRCYGGNHRDNDRIGDFINSRSLDFRPCLWCESWLEGLSAQRRLVIGC